MTGVDTVGYNIGLVLPKPSSRRVAGLLGHQRNAMSRRKWTQVLFVSRRRGPLPGGHGDLPGSPAVTRGAPAGSTSATRPDFRTDAPNTGILPARRHARRVQDLDGQRWFQNQDTWTTQFAGPGTHPTGQTPTRRPGSSTASTNMPNNVVRMTKDDTEPAPGRST